MRLSAAAAALAMLVAASPAPAQDEHARRLAAELLIMQGDLRRLAAPDTPAPQRRGLRARLGGALASLPLLLRLAGGQADEAYALRGADPAALAAALAALAQRYPLDVSKISPPMDRGSSDPHESASEDARSRLIAAGAAIHAEACAGCHEAGASESELPARELRADARAMPADEFAARLIGGLRGDRLTGLANPFPDRDLAALFAFYRFSE